MLQVPAPFPYPGSHGFLVPSAEPCRILQRRADGRLLVSLTKVSPHHPDRATAASGNRTIALHEIAATAQEAVEPRKPSRRRKAKAGNRS